MSKKHKIGIKSRVAKQADILKYDGKCYYRTGKQSFDNNVSTKNVESYYLPECPTYVKTLTSLPLCAQSCETGEQILHPNQALAIEPLNHWFQFKFVPNKVGDSAILKFIKTDFSWFAKNIKYDTTGVIFDPGGPDEHVFNTRSYPTSHTFTADSIEYCLTYAHPGSYVFVMAVSGVSDYGAPTPTPTATLPPTPTPTPTTPADEKDMLCDGINYCVHSTWPTSASTQLAFWFDSARVDTLRSPNADPRVKNGDSVIEWLDVSGRGRHIKQTDNFNFAPTYLSAGKIGGPKRRGPGVKFKQDFTNGSDYLSFDSDPVMLDHRAVFFVATTDRLRGNGEQGVITGVSNKGGANSAYGNMFTLEQMRSHWVGVNISQQPRQSIYSGTYTGGDGGQFYMNGHAIEDNAAVVGYGTSTYVDGAIYGGVRTNPKPALIDGLCVGAGLKLNQGFGGGWDGEINEIIILDHEPSDELRQEIEGYLAWKWGLVEYLPADHPCKTGTCEFPTPTPTVEPTPLPPPPDPTPEWPKPPVPGGPPDGVNLVTMTQLYDVLTQRNRTSTLWLGGMYQRDWELTKARLDAVTGSNNIIEQITTANKYVIDQMKDTLVPVKLGAWQAQYYEHYQPGIECPGGENLTIRSPWNGDWVDNVDTQLLYCLGGIQLGTLNSDKTLYELLPSHDWANFVNTVVKSPTLHPDLMNMMMFEQTIQTPLSIDTAAFTYNILDAFLPLTTLYRLDADLSNPSPLSNHRVRDLNVGDNATRVDVAAHLMYHHAGLAFWQAPVVFDNRYSVELIVKLPGARDDMKGYDNMLGDMEWEVQAEVIDRDTYVGAHERVTTKLPRTATDYISKDIPSIIIEDVGGYRFKITPYFGDWRGSTTVDLINNAQQGRLPILFARIDREKNL